MEIKLPNGDRKQCQRKSDKSVVWKAFVCIVSVVFAAGITYAGVRANTQKIKQLDTRTMEYNGRLINIEKDVGFIKETAKESKKESREQRQILTEILIEVKSR